MRIPVALWMMAAFTTVASAKDIFNPNLSVDSFGVDRNGWIHAIDAYQPSHDASLMVLLENLGLTEHVMAGGSLASVVHIGDDHPIFKRTLTLSRENAEAASLDKLKVAFKAAYPEKAGWTYSREWKREMAFYNLGNILA